MKVTGLSIHPLKSGRAVPQTAVTVDLDGLAGDRRFMLVEPDGHFITQRELQVLAQVQAEQVDGGVSLRMNGQELSIRFDPDDRLDVRVWSSDVNAAVADDVSNDVLSGWFGRAVKLVHMDAEAERFVGAEWAGVAAPVGFADGFPILVTTTGSLADLNRTLVEKGQEPVGMERFRTNILIDCDEAWAEDLWESIEIAGITFDLVKPCSRCIMTTQDQTTGERMGGNPIQGLAEKRMSADRRVPGVLFGWNAVPRGEGILRLGDAVKVVRRRHERWPMKMRSAG
ncbi:MOSC domain-containing protein [Sinorhizobium medicae]|uniref:MOSC domain-containing protein n=1 Tax=Sinorhizobium medicae TaxID=110321 RepID=UPI000379A3C8|nr:MOSC domain-containing protein [Sinorhizobium medicae]MDX0423515.1 MOSC domain-containing protein [Sinorhizobium medicae]MDX0626442.1 MOSC domain-containing protein [Sinorhizobium medicae]MDX0829636.1 MOSC domain-containing protein [Sinorhizobium medicae]MDX0878690.1 MOSC domain-containing protein [Sinorhizobium medicae]MQX80999.1 MOSC domain-containing protein [Sinorhizobium medicae]